MAHYKPIFKSKKRKYYLKEFSILWWLKYIGIGALFVFSFYLFYIVLWALCG